jgi:ribosomal protein L40E
MLCAKCNYDNPADALFCMKCGTKVESRCSTCNTVNPVDANFCRKCGGALAAGVPVSSPSPYAALETPRVEVTQESKTAEGLEGERKTVTALFADIKGSTELMEDLDPEEARAIVDPALKLMIEAVRRYDGYVVQSTGDGVFALFGAPVAHEDHPQRALYPNRSASSWSIALPVRCYSILFGSVYLTQLAGSSGILRDSMGSHAA